MSGVAGILAASREAKAKPEQIELEDAIGAAKPAKEAKPTRTRKPKALTSQPVTKAWTRGEGRSSNPDYEKIGAYVRRETRKTAMRKWEDETGEDLSALIQHLLTGYIGD